MKRTIIAIVFALVSLGIGCAPALISYSSEIPESKPVQNKALVMIVRPAPEKGAIYHSDKMSPIYVDGTFGAMTTANSMVMLQADTGEHYIVSKIDNVSVVKFTFAANKVYYLLQKVSPISVSAPTKGFGKPTGGLTRVNTFLDPMTPDEFNDVMKKSKGAIRYARYDMSKPMKNLEPSEVKHYRSSYEYWAKSVPDKAKKHMEYPGY